MKPTRKIPKTKMTGIWKTKRSVWNQKNDDDDLGGNPNASLDDPRLESEKRKTVRDMSKEELRDNIDKLTKKLDDEGKWSHKNKRWKALTNEFGRRVSPGLYK